MHVILTHEHADFDAVASLLGAALLMPDAVAVLPRQVNRNVRDFLIIYGGHLPLVEPDALPRKRIERATLVDTQSAQYPRGMGAHTRIQIIDHHRLTRKDIASEDYWGGETGACATLLVEEICRRDIDLGPIEATLLLLGIYEDTGSLAYTGTTPRDLRAAAWLIEQGANLEVASHFLHHPLSDAQRQLYDRLVANAQTCEIAGHAVVIAAASALNFEDELSTVAHKLRDLLDPAALFMLVDLGEHIQLVARSTTDAIPVGEIAQVFGGGGHSRAAAAMIQNSTLDEVVERLKQVLREHIRPRVTVREIMSHGAVRTLSPDTTVAEAAEQMRRYGYEGYPVVKGGQVIGLLTRREVDRAMHHRLGNAPIETYMRKGAVTISPDASVEELQKRMMELDVGQIPVVENGKIIGIVTRTDLLKLWGRPAQQGRAAEIAAKLESALPPPLLELLRLASQTANELGQRLFIVGGFVRDLLLGVPHGPDVDLVVEGDAIQLARELRRRHGGRVRSHARFGTAKWILPSEWAEQPGVPDALDFVTARREFYEKPTALPSVERGSLKSDLGRRDFTINTMAINLTPDRYGELLDFYGGEADLRRGLIRVLHNLSFVEDPTRILRAARLAERLGFEIESRTRELIDDALNLLDRVSGDRIRHELYAAFREEKPERILKRLDEWKVLRAVHPALYYDNWLEEKFRALRAHLSKWYRMDCRRAGVRNHRPPAPPKPPQQPEPVHYLALWLFRLEAAQVEGVLNRLKVPRNEARLVRQMPPLRQAAEKLADPALRRSRVYHVLEPFDPDAVGILWIATDDAQVQQHAALYHRELQCIQPELDGYYLKELGVRPGPIYREILTTLRDARLDGEVRTREEEEALVARVLEERAVNGAFS